MTREILTPMVVTRLGLPLAQIVAAPAFDAALPATASVLACAVVAAAVAPSALALAVVAGAVLHPASVVHVKLLVAALPSSAAKTVAVAAQAAVVAVAAQAAVVAVAAVLATSGAHLIY